MKIQTSEEKLNYVKKYLDKLMSIAEQATEKERYNLALSALSAYCRIQYTINQVYTDQKAENLLLQISEKTVSIPTGFQGEKNTVLFYDGFGLDRRGIAIVMCRAIVKNGYHLVYASPLNTKEKQPTLKKSLDGYNVDWVYYDTDSPFLRTISDIERIIKKYCPFFAFLYTTPNDVSGVALFDSLKGKCFRCQLDLTDHAFWIGTNAFDMCNGGRQFSASIEHYERGISKKSLSFLDANLFIDDCSFQGLPFDVNNRFIFSGGQLYKTLGDENDTFYKIIEHVLNKFPDIAFLYAGSGDSSKMHQLIQKFPEKAFLIPERPDFYQIIERCTLYLNTYPMFGGLMMRYAALAGKLPITLRHENDSDGILIEQQNRRIEYDSFVDLIEDIDKLLSDESYLREREKLLIGSVVTEECFIRNIRMLIENHETEFKYDEIKPVDTSQFRKEYVERFEIAELSPLIAQKRNLMLMPFFPRLFVHRLLCKIQAKIFKGEQL